MPCDISNNCFILLHTEVLFYYPVICKTDVLFLVQPDKLSKILFLIAGQESLITKVRKQPRIHCIRPRMLNGPDYISWAPIEALFSSHVVRSDQRQGEAADS